MNLITRLTLLFIFLGIFLGCSETNEDEKLFSMISEAGISENITINYPSENTIFPPELPSPEFMWTDNSVAVRWAVMIDLKNDDINEDPFVSGRYINYCGLEKWTPDSTLWESVKKHSSGSDFLFSVIGLKAGKEDVILSSAKFSVSISGDSVAAPIFYRSVTLPFIYAFNNLNTISWRLGYIDSKEEPRVVLRNMYVCANCHSFTPDGKRFGMDIDYGNDKGSYVIGDLDREIHLTSEKIITWSDYKREDKEQTFGLLSSISPDGRYVLSTVKDRSIFVPKDDKYYSQLFFPIKGIIAVYDTKAKKYFSLPGADDPEFVQSNPVWSPDGKHILFAKAPVYHCEEAEKSKRTVLPMSVAADFLEGKKGFKYDIYRIEFNDGKGGTATPLEGASENGKSNFFPRYSPDGKWIVFTMAENFMLLQPDSRLFIIPAEGGSAREMNCNNDAMNSWHSWSPNSRWLVFSSKAKGPYTQLFLTHIDEEGNDSPPIFLEHFNIRERGANIPEFVNIRKGQLVRMVDKFVEDKNYYVISGIKKSGTGDYAGAVEDFTKAIEQNPEDLKAYLDRGAIYAKLGNAQGALEDFSQAVKLDPLEVDAVFNRGGLLLKLGKLAPAEKDFNTAARLTPDDFNIYFFRGTTRMRLKKHDKAISDFSRSIELNPDYSYSYYFRGLCKLEADNADYCYDFNMALNLGCKEAVEAIKQHCME